MMLSNEEQLLRLFYCLGFGVVLCVYSDLFRLWQYVTAATPIRRFFSDVVLCVTGGLGFFLFSLAVSGGTLRLAMLVAAAVGFAVTRLTVSRLWTPLAARLKRFTRPLCDAFRALRAKAVEKATISLKKVGIFLKKGLHSIRDVVYNKRTNK